MNLPNFLIIGAARSGTTALYSYLEQHPEIYMSPVKEPNFFALEGEDISPEKRIFGLKESIFSLEDYQALFAGVSHQKAIGEASPLYLYKPKAAATIQAYLPNVKLIAILRNPVERVYSHFVFNVGRGREKHIDLSQALAEQKRRISNQEPWWELPLIPYIEGGFYFEQLKRYFDRFSADQIRVYLYDDFSKNSLQVIQDIFKFLEVDPTFAPNISQRINAAQMSKNKTLQSFLDQPNLIKSILRALLPSSLRQNVSQSLRKQNVAQPSFPAELRQQLREIYRLDILNLEELLERDLSEWLQG